MFPGGFGTLDELFEILTLKQTGKVPPIPILLVHEDYWRGVINFQRLGELGMVSEEDLRIFEFANDAEGAWRILIAITSLSRVRSPRPGRSGRRQHSDLRAGSQMRAMVLRETGKPLRLEEVPLPNPGFGELRVRVEACAVCRTDLHVVDGELSCPTLPLIPGHEIVGIVDVLGDGVSGVCRGREGRNPLARSHLRPLSLLHVRP